MSVTKLRLEHQSTTLEKAPSHKIPLYVVEVSVHILIDKLGCSNIVPPLEKVPFEIRVPMSKRAHIWIGSKVFGRVLGH